MIFTWIVSIIVPIILKIIEIIPHMITKKREMPRVRRAKERAKGLVLKLRKYPTIEEIAEAGRKKGIV